MLNLFENTILSIKLFTIELSQTNLSNKPVIIKSDKKHGKWLGYYSFNAYNFENTHAVLLCSQSIHQSVGVELLFLNRRKRLDFFCKKAKN
jgi:hypothetical protein